jgi:hypothetical protein
MDEEPDMNQPAFPTWKNNQDVTEGMTLRDFFAAAALQGMYANPHHHYNTHYMDAQEAYAMADVMLNIRSK